MRATKRRRKRRCSSSLTWTPLSNCIVITEGHEYLDLRQCSLAIIKSNNYTLMRVYFLWWILLNASFSCYLTSKGLWSFSPSLKYPSFFSSFLTASFVLIPKGGLKVHRENLLIIWQMYHETSFVFNIFYDLKINVWQCLALLNRFWPLDHSTNRADAKEVACGCGCNKSLCFFEPMWYTWS